MPSSRPTLRTSMDLPVPDLTPMVTAWWNTATAVGIDAVAEANRQWLQWWFDSAAKAVDVWWDAVLDRR